MEQVIFFWKINNDVIILVLETPEMEEIETDIC